MPNPSKLKKLNAAKIFLLKVEVWHFQTSTEIVMSVDQPMKAHIEVSHYLIPSVNHRQLTDLIFFHNCSDKLWLANQNPNKTTSLASRLFEM